MSAAAGPPDHRATADAFLRRQLLLSWLSALLVLVVLALVALALLLAPQMRYAPPRHYPWVVRTLVLAVVVATALFFVLVAHAVRVAKFALRREVA